MSTPLLTFGYNTLILQTYFYIFSLFYNKLQKLTILKWLNMLHEKLNYSAFMLSQQAQSLSAAALLWAGDRKQAILTFNPIKQVVCFTVQDLQAFVANQASLPADTEPKPTKPISDQKGWHSFRSGWLGYFSYEAGHTLLTGDNRSADMPLAEFFEYSFSVVLDFNTDETVLFYRAEVDVAEVLRTLNTLVTDPISLPKTANRASNKKGAEPLQPWSTAWNAVWNAQQYQQAFNQVQSYLNAGDCYQVNLAMPFVNGADLRTNSPLPLLRSFNPAFGGYLKTDYLSLYSVSPERFICIDGERIETRPIKGTVARGANAAEDETNKTWLANSAKNQAENLMIVDLLRNDLSRYALPFSVKVEKLFTIETHANVHHMVSTISALKRPEVSPAEVILNALPGGSITGAPKKRAMEVIAELEAGARGPYCGVMGFFDDSGYVDFNILIRTVVAKENGAQCWAGGGVVLDSTCEEEWQELHVKVARILEQFG